MIPQHGCLYSDGYCSARSDRQGDEGKPQPPSLYVNESSSFQKGQVTGALIATQRKHKARWCVLIPTIRPRTSEALANGITKAGGSPPVQQMSARLPLSVTWTFHLHAAWWPAHETPQPIHSSDGPCFTLPFFFFNHSFSDASPCAFSERLLELISKCVENTHTTWSRDENWETEKLSVFFLSRSDKSFFSFFLFSFFFLKGGLIIYCLLLANISGVLGRD